MVLDININHKRTEFVDFVFVLFFILFLLIFLITFFSRFAFIYHFSNRDVSISFSNEIVNFLNYQDNNLKAILNEKEYNHMLEVKKIINHLFSFSICMIIVLLDLIVILLENSLNGLKTKSHNENNTTNAKTNKKNNKIKIILISFLFANLMILIIALNFNFFFELMHKILFPNGNYSFPRDSILIINFNETFFIRFFMFSYLFSLLFQMIVILELVKRIKYNSKQMKT